MRRTVLLVGNLLKTYMLGPELGPELEMADIKNDSCQTLCSWQPCMLSFLACVQGLQATCVCAIGLRARAGFGEH